MAAFRVNKHQHEISACDAISGRFAAGFLFASLCCIIMYLHVAAYSRNDVARDYVIKNSSHAPEDRVLTRDPDEQEDFPLPGVFWLPSQEVYFTSAFLDTRYNQSVVRLVGVQLGNHTAGPVCVFKDEQAQEIRVKAEVHFVFPFWPKASLYVAAIYSCRSPPSTSGAPGSPQYRTAIRVCSNKELACVSIPLSHPRAGGATPRKDLAICAKAYSGELDWRRLVEWFETNRLLGVSSVVVYDGGIRGRARRVLDYYSAQRLVRRLPFALLGALQEHATSNYLLSKEQYFSISQQVYLASLNDCVLRYGPSYEFILIIDYDETLLPARDESLFSMATRHAKRYRHTAGLTFHTAWHFADFPITPCLPDNTSNITLFPTPSTRNNNSPNTNTNALQFQRHTARTNHNKNTPVPRLYTLEHNRRTAISNNQPKSLVQADRVLSVNWHGVTSAHPTSAASGLNVVIKPADDSAYVHHYRGNCIDKFVMATCDVLLRNSYVDDVVPRYADRMRRRVRRAYDALGMRGA